MIIPAINNVGIVPVTNITKSDNKETFKIPKPIAQEETQPKFYVSDSGIMLGNNVYAQCIIPKDIFIEAYEKFIKDE